MTNGPELWTKVLAQMPAGSIIAGGAVRDYLLGVEPKDIDVFCSDRNFTIPEGFALLEGAEQDEEYEAMSEIDVVARGVIEGYQVDLVFMTLEPFNAQTLVESFDVTASQCWFDGSCHAYAAATGDLAEGLVTVLRYERLPRTIERFDRFNARHDGCFQLIFDPERVRGLDEFDFTPLQAGEVAA
jgi:hypothetical protein